MNLPPPPEPKRPKGLSWKRMDWEVERIGIVGVVLLIVLGIIAILAFGHFGWV